MNNIESLLRHSLSPTEGDAPDPRINQKIMQTDQEVIPMNKKQIRRPILAILASAAIIVSGGLAATAAWHYLNPAQVAEEVSDDSLAQAFRSKDAIAINEAQIYGDYKITLMGMVSGKAISSQHLETSGELQDNRTYAVLSIENRDGSPLSAHDNISEIDDRIFFTVSPFIQGQPTNRINVTTMNGGICTFLKNGIMYQLADCDSLEAFADREVYLSVTDTRVLDSSAFEMSKDTGRISRRKDYPGVNALFTLPLDPKKADTKKADAQLKAWLEPVTSEKTEFTIGTDDRKSTDAERITSGWTVEDIKKKCVCLEEFTKNAKPDKEGLIHFSYSQDGHGGDGSFNLEYEFRNKKAGTTLEIGRAADEERVEFYVATKEADGSYTIRLYEINVADIK